MWECHQYSASLYYLGLIMYLLCSFCNKNFHVLFLQAKTDCKMHLLRAIISGWIALTVNRRDGRVPSAHDVLVHAS